MPERTSGTVKWFNAAKGYGFLSQDDEGPDVYVNASAIQPEDLRRFYDGLKVEFSILSGQKRLQARDVKVIHP